MGFRKWRCCWKKTEREMLDKEANSPVPFLGLFRFASNFDAGLMAISVTACVIHGTCLPTLVILFGDLATIIVDATAPSTWNNTENNTQCQYSSHLNQIAPKFLKPDSDEMMDAAFFFAIGTTAIAFLSMFLNLIFITSLNIAAENQIYRLRSAVVKVILAQEIGWHDTRTTDGLAVRISEDLIKIQDGIGEKVGLFISYSSIATFSLICAFYYGWELASITLVILPVLTVAAGILARIQSSLTTRERQAYASAGSLAEEIIGAIKTVTIFGAQEKEVDRFNTSLIPARKAGIRRGLVTAIGGGVVWILTYASYALSFWYGIRLVLQSMCTESDTKYDAGILNIVFFNMLYAALKLGQLLPFFEAFTAARVSAGNVYRILDQNPEIDSSSTAGKQLDQIDGYITIEKVDFSYSSRPDVAVLREISFEVAAGLTVALVGPSGCGKSTSVQLIQRFYDPIRGRITIDGHDLKTLNVRWLRQNIGVVGQEPVLFSMTIGDNIKYGHPRYDEISRKDIEHAAKQANAHDFISSLPDGYDTMVGERGAHLSGGQKQRIAIARALIRNPKILLFDEATSALDTRSEAVVQQALDKAREGRTTLIVAHRLTTIRNADLILVFNEGKIEEQGNHESLMSKRGLYYKLVESQEQGFTSSNVDDQREDSWDPLQAGGSEPTDGSGSLPLVEIDVQDSIASSEIHSRERLEERENDISMWMLFRWNKPEWKYIALGVIGSVIMGLSTPVYAIVFGELMGLLDQSLQEDVLRLNNILALIFLGVAFGTGIGAFLQTFMLTLAGEKLTFRLRILTFRSILLQKIEWFDRQENSVGALCVRLSSDASAIQGATGSRIGLLVQVSVSIFFALTLAMFYSWKLALACGVFVPLVLLSAAAEVKMNAGQNVKKTKALEESTRVATEAISNIRTVASLGREETFHSRYMTSLHQPHISAKKLMPVRALIFGLTSNMSVFASVVCMTYGTYLIQREGLAYKNVFIICEALVFGMEMVGYTLAFTPNYSRAKSSAKRILQLIENQSAQLETRQAEHKNMKLEGRVEFDNVRFCYPTRADVPVLRGLSTTIYAGQTVALVGHSGCGKSTFIQLLQRFYDPNSGSIFVDDVDVSKISVDSFRANVGIVSQEPVLFNRTIAENIAYGDQTRAISMEEIIHAARKANIHHFIQSLPLGYETPVGQKGTQLSGGQKQRIAIARALVRHPRILLLDEATSALDSESEKVVQDALDQASQGRTCIIIAHRLSTIKDVDEILVFDGGKIKEHGKHEDLIRLKGIYYQLWTIQGLSNSTNNVQQ